MVKSWVFVGSVFGCLTAKIPKGKSFVFKERFQLCGPINGGVLE